MLLPLTFLWDYVLGNVLLLLPLVIGLLSMKIFKADLVIWFSIVGILCSSWCLERVEVGTLFFPFFSLLMVYMSKIIENRFLRTTVIYLLSYLPFFILGIRWTGIWSYLIMIMIVWSLERKHSRFTGKHFGI
ncbi:MAG: hypothetical protein J7L52_04685 [Thermotogae bacterium]|nr:hypothetical protein [Thermotogota bacterium]